MNRRQFLKAAAAYSLFPGALRGQDLPAAIGDMPYRTLGHTGEGVLIVGLGGAHIGVSNIAEVESQRIIRTGIDSGINFMDNSWSYNGGQSEIRMGKALRDGYRQRILLMTKLDGRDARSATMQLDESLKRLQVDHVDLIQFHDVARMDDPEKIFAPSSALEAIIKARTTGKVRYIGFTGHKSPPSSSAHAQYRVPKQIHVRYGANAVERYGCALPQLRQTSASCARTARHRRARYEVHGRSCNPAQRGCNRIRMLALCHDPSNQSRYNRVRFDGHSATGD